MGYTHGTRWDEESIRSGILEVVESLELDRMPSRKEVEQYYHDTSLTNAVSKRMGWYRLAQMMGLPIKDSETYFGKRHEESAKEMLIAKGFEVRRMPQNFPYDLFVNDRIKVDVKASRLYQGPNGNFYTFNLEKPFATCDLYLLFLVNDDNTIKDVLVVPSKDVPTNSQISVGEHSSKYYSYSQRWDYFELYDQFLATVS